MDTLHELAEYARTFARIAYAPFYMPCPNPSGEKLRMSRVGGPAFLPGTVEWPTRAGLPMVFVVQLRIDALPVPIGPHTDGMIQLFVPQAARAPHLDVAADPEWRWLSPDQLTGVALPAPPGLPQLKSRRISRWKLRADLPGPDALEEIPGLSNDYEAGSATDLYLSALSDSSYDKLLGWPVWPHDYDEAPACGACGRSMAYFLQLGGLAEGADDYFLAFACSVCPAQLRLLWGD